MIHILEFSLYTLLLFGGEVQGSEKDPLAALADYTGNDAGELIHVGDLFVEANRLKEAKKLYSKSERYGAKNGEALLGNARIRMAKGQFSQVKKACRLISQEFPKGVEGEVCFGWFWLTNGRSARAIEYFEQVVKKGDLARGKTGLGEALRKSGDFEAAAAAYAEAIEAGAGYLAYMGRGLAEETFGDKSAALASLKKAVSMEPASCLARFHYGRLLTPGGEAIEQLEMALKLRPSWPEAGMALGKVHLELGQNQQAIEAYKGTLSRESGSGEAYFGMGGAYYNMGKKEEAREALQKTIELIPNHKGAFLLLADIHSEAGNNAEAVEVLERARRVAAGDPNVFVKSGEIFYKMGRHTSARSFLEQAISMNPKLSKAQAILGHIACERHLYDTGVEYYNAALKGDMVGVDDKEIKRERRSCRPKPKK